MEDLLIELRREGVVYQARLTTLQDQDSLVFGRENRQQSGIIGLRSSQASHQHFQIVRRGQDYLVEDLRSRNGTFVNGVLIQEPTALPKSGWHIQPGPSAKVEVQVRPLSSWVSDGEDPPSYYREETKSDSEVGSLELDGWTWYTRNDKMKRLFGTIAAVAATPFPILLEGERGSGKGTLARAIHKWSGYRDFVDINSNQLNTEVGWNALVGHLQGSFSGAHEDRPGFLGSIDDGTLFLDEIDSLTDTAQAKLLTTFNFEKFHGKVHYYKTGDTRRLSADARIIAATTSRLEAQRFRPELLDRISLIHLEVPPLRERIKDDLDFFLDRILHRIKGGTSWDIEIAPAARKALLEYDYPGNIRDLEKILVNARILSNSSLLTATVVERALEGLKSSPVEEFIPLEEPSPTSQGIVETFERTMMKEYARMGKTKTETANLLYGGMGDRSKLLNRRLKKYGLEELWKK